MANTIALALGDEGLQITQLARIIITHQDLDHIGALRDLKAGSGATIMAHSIEAPYIDGRQELVKFTLFKDRPDIAVMKAAFQPNPVEQLLEDGDRLDLAGGVQVIFTPGHSPGHICLYLERNKTLIAGDALTTAEGRLQGPNPPVTPDMPRAIKSVQRLAQLDVAAIVCYHGGVVQDDANNQLRRLAQELAAA
ncbi:MAG: MBL fold metallo-hydrolase [Oscillochloris sp.]|nr:MBL fold metallo-hydrolase [Oscillochloris sp.]